MEQEELTHKIIGCAMKVHSNLGNGYQEFIYLKALAIEFETNGIAFESEKNLKIFYKEVEVGTRPVDFLVEKTIMLELKAVSQLEDLHLTQAMNYCKAYRLPIGLLINFGSKSLSFKRVYNKNHLENKNKLKS
jgi:GxxExxY protein